MNDRKPTLMELAAELEAETKKLSALLDDTPNMIFNVMTGYRLNTKSIQATNIRRGRAYVKK